jgi:hypothetical protein
LQALAPALTLALALPACALQSELPDTPPPGLTEAWFHDDCAPWDGPAGGERAFRERAHGSGAAAAIDNAPARAGQQATEAPCDVVVTDVADAARRAIHANRMLRFRQCDQFAHPASFRVSPSPAAQA